VGGINSSHGFDAMDSVALPKLVPKFYGDGGDQREGGKSSSPFSTHAGDFRKFRASPEKKKRVDDHV